MRWQWALLAVLAGCGMPQGEVASQALPPQTEGLPFVEAQWGGGMFSGVNTIRLYETGDWTFASTTSGEAGNRTGAAGPEAYATARGTALQGIAALGPQPAEACPDFGSDTVRVSDGAQVVAEVTVFCPVSGVTDLIVAVRDAISVPAAL